MVDFTEEELYFIESQFDCLAATNSERIHRVCEQILLAKAQQPTHEPSVKALFAHVEELYRTHLVMKSIRNKCEAHRKEGKHEGNR